jgi:hypothetical protein
MGATMTTVPDPIGRGPDPGSILAAGAPMAEREGRLVEGADQLESARPTILSHPRLLIGAAAALMSLGVSAVVLGWVGASHSTLVEEQVPYLISGGLLGVALSTIGALLFFTHWLTVGIKEARQHEAARRQDHVELVEALRGLHPAPNHEGSTNGDARGTQPQRPLRRAPRGS